MEDVWKHKPFSFIHLRSLAGSLKDWPRLFEQAFSNLEPGGWLEVVEFEVWVRDQKDESADAKDKELVDATMISKWQEGLAEAGDKIGRRFDVGVNLKKWMEQAGFIEVVERVIKVCWCFLMLNSGLGLGF